MACTTPRNYMVKGKKKPSKHSLGYSSKVPCPFAAHQCNISFLYVPWFLNFTGFLPFSLLFPSTGKRPTGVIFTVKKWKLLPSLFCEHLLLSTRLEMYHCFICKG